MNHVRSGFVLMAAAAAASCGPAAVGPQQAASAPVERLEATSAPDFRPYVGQTYAAFAAAPAMRRYSLQSLGVPAAEQARFTHSMSNPAPGLVAGGGGAEALVFSGCAPSGCLEGLSVVAIDMSSGDVFIGVSDAAGAEKLVPNERLEALLRLTSPSQTWDDPVRPPATAAP
ncbi:MAG TPA: hypothetical protein VEA80_00325 [Vitreimonas sp.]|uniref:hypothetical protein n=1 Tax=Vitreimonas sp. TaxID=3069702 RepID=UPI002D6EAED3|nr:hypothetical protein [Vitreimonas sp.]HYD85898.1 hypothetical protein [Vitreimonas sp.]